MTERVATVCGAGGVMAAWIVPTLQRRGFHVRAVDIRPRNQWCSPFHDTETLQLDLSALEACRAAVDGATHVYDLAAELGNIEHIRQHRADCTLNVLISANLLKACCGSTVERFLFASSACVYRQDLQGRRDTAHMAEAHAYPAMPEPGYGWEKLFSEHMCEVFCQEYGIATRIARYHNLFGPPSTFRGGREKAPGALCRKVAEAKLSGADTIEIWGSGEQMRSFLYLSDAIDLTFLLMDGDYSSPVNIGSDRLVSINTFVDIIERIAGTHLRRIYRPEEKKTGVLYRNSDNTLVKQLFGWEPTVSLEDGLERTYRWVYDQLLGASPAPFYPPG